MSSIASNALMMAEAATVQMLEAQHAKDRHYSAFASDLDTALQGFEKARDWTDLITSLQHVQKVLDSAKYRKFPLIPASKVPSLTGALAQCMNPGLPSGVYILALAVFKLIFDRLATEFLLKDLALYSQSWLSAMPHVAESVKPAIVALIERYLLPLESRLRPTLPGLISALLSGIGDAALMGRKVYVHRRQLERAGANESKMDGMMVGTEAGLGDVPSPTSSHASPVAGSVVSSVGTSTTTSSTGASSAAMSQAPFRNAEGSVLSREGDIPAACASLLTALRIATDETLFRHTLWQVLCFNPKLRRPAFTFIHFAALNNAFWTPSSQSLGDCGPQMLDPAEELLAVRALTACLSGSGGNNSNSARVLEADIEGPVQMPSGPTAGAPHMGVTDPAITPCAEEDANTNEFPCTSLDATLQATVSLGKPAELAVIRSALDVILILFPLVQTTRQPDAGETAVPEEDVGDEETFTAYDVISKSAVQTLVSGALLTLLRGEVSISRRVFNWIPPALLLVRAKLHGPESPSGLEYRLAPLGVLVVRALAIIVETGIDALHELLRGSQERLPDDHLSHFLEDDSELPDLWRDYLWSKVLRMLVGRWHHGIHGEMKPMNVEEPAPLSLCNVSSDNRLLLQLLQISRALTAPFEIIQVITEAMRTAFVDEPSKARPPSLLNARLVRSFITDLFHVCCKFSRFCGDIHGRAQDLTTQPHSLQQALRSISETPHRTASAVLELYSALPLIFTLLEERMRTLSEMTDDEKAASRRRGGYDIVAVYDAAMMLLRFFPDPLRPMMSRSSTRPIGDSFVLTVINHILTDISNAQEQLTSRLERLHRGITLLAALLQSIQQNVHRTRLRTTSALLHLQAHSDCDAGQSESQVQCRALIALILRLLEAVRRSTWSWTDRSALFLRTSELALFAAQWGSYISVEVWVDTALSLLLINDPLDRSMSELIVPGSDLFAWNMFVSGFSLLLSEATETTVSPEHMAGAIQALDRLVVQCAMDASWSPLDLSESEIVYPACQHDTNRTPASIALSRFIWNQPRLVATYCRARYNSIMKSNHSSKVVHLRMLLALVGKSLQILDYSSRQETTSQLATVKLQSALDSVANGSFAASGLAVEMLSALNALPRLDSDSVLLMKELQLIRRHCVISILEAGLNSEDAKESESMRQWLREELSATATPSGYDNTLNVACALDILISRILKPLRTLPRTLFMPDALARSPVDGYEDEPYGMPERQCKRILRTSRCRTAAASEAVPITWTVWDRPTVVVDKQSSDYHSMPKEFADELADARNALDMITALMNQVPGLVEYSFRLRLPPASIDSSTESSSWVSAISMFQQVLEGGSTAVPCVPWNEYFTSNTELAAFDIAEAAKASAELLHPAAREMLFHRLPSCARTILKTCGQAIVLAALEWLNSLAPGGSFCVLDSLRVSAFKLLSHILLTLSTQAAHPLISVIVPHSDISSYIVRSTRDAVKTLRSYQCEHYRGEYDALADVNSASSSVEDEIPALSEGEQYSTCGKVWCSLSLDALGVSNSRLGQVSDALEGGITQDTDQMYTLPAPEVRLLRVKDCARGVAELHMPLVPPLTLIQIRLVDLIAPTVFNLLFTEISLLRESTDLPEGDLFALVSIVLSMNVHNPTYAFLSASFDSNCGSVLPRFNMKAIYEDDALIRSGFTEPCSRFSDKGHAQDEQFSATALEGLDYRVSFNLYLPECIAREVPWSDGANTFDDNHTSEDSVLEEPNTSPAPWAEVSTSTGFIDWEPAQTQLLRGIHIALAKLVDAITDSISTPEVTRGTGAIHPDLNKRATNFTRWQILALDALRLARASISNLLTKIVGVTLGAAQWLWCFALSQAPQHSKARRAGETVLLRLPLPAYFRQITFANSQSRSLNSSMTEQQSATPHMFMFDTSVLSDYAGVCDYYLHAGAELPSKAEGSSTILGDVNLSLLTTARLLAVWQQLVETAEIALSFCAIPSRITSAPEAIPATALTPAMLAAAKNVAKDVSASAASPLYPLGATLIKTTGAPEQSPNKVARPKSPVQKPQPKPRPSDSPPIHMLNVPTAHAASIIGHISGQSYVESKAKTGPSDSLKSSSGQTSEGTASQKQRSEPQKPTYSHASSAYLGLGVPNSLSGAAFGPPTSVTGQNSNTSHPLPPPLPSFNSVQGSPQALALTAHYLALSGIPVIPLTKSHKHSLLREGEEVFDHHFRHSDHWSTASPGLTLQQLELLESTLVVIHTPSVSTAFDLIGRNSTPPSTPPKFQWEHRQPAGEAKGYVRSSSAGASRTTIDAVPPCTTSSTTKQSSTPPSQVEEGGSSRGFFSWILGLGSGNKPSGETASVERPDPVPHLSALLRAALEHSSTGIGTTPRTPCVFLPQMAAHLLVRAGVNPKCLGLGSSEYAKPIEMVRFTALQLLPALLDVLVMGCILPSEPFFIFPSSAADRPDPHLRELASYFKRLAEYFRFRAVEALLPFGGIYPRRLLATLILLWSKQLCRPHHELATFEVHAHQGRVPLSTIRIKRAHNAKCEFKDPFDDLARLVNTNLENTHDLQFTRAVGLTPANLAATGAFSSISGGNPQCDCTTVASGCNECDKVAQATASLTAEALIRGGASCEIPLENHISSQLPSMSASENLFTRESCTLLAWNTPPSINELTPGLIIPVGKSSEQLPKVPNSPQPGSEALGDVNVSSLQSCHGAPLSYTLDKEASVVQGCGHSHSIPSRVKFPKGLQPGGDDAALVAALPKAPRRSLIRAVVLDLAFALGSIFVPSLVAQTVVHLYSCLSDLESLSHQEPTEIEPCEPDDARLKIRIPNSDSDQESDLPATLDAFVEVRPTALSRGLCAIKLVRGQRAFSSGVNFVGDLGTVIDKATLPCLPNADGSILQFLESYLAYYHPPCLGSASYLCNPPVLPSTTLSDSTLDTLLNSPMCSPMWMVSNRRFVSPCPALKIPIPDSILTPYVDAIERLIFSVSEPFLILSTTGFNGSHQLSLDLQDLLKHMRSPFTASILFSAFRPLSVAIHELANVRDSANNRPTQDPSRALAPSHQTHSAFAGTVPAANAPAVAAAAAHSAATSASTSAAGVAAATANAAAMAAAATVQNVGFYAGAASSHPEALIWLFSILRIFMHRLVRGHITVPGFQFRALLTAPPPSPALALALALLGRTLDKWQKGTEKIDPLPISSRESPLRESAYPLPRVHIDTSALLQNMLGASTTDPPMEIDDAHFDSLIPYLTSQLASGAVDIPDKVSEPTKPKEQQQSIFVLAARLARNARLVSKLLQTTRASRPNQDTVATGNSDPPRRARSIFAANPLFCYAIEEPVMFWSWELKSRLERDHQAWHLTPPRFSMPASTHTSTHVAGDLPMRNVAANSGWGPLQVYSAKFGIRQLLLPPPPPPPPVMPSPPTLPKEDAKSAMSMLNRGTSGDAQDAVERVWRLASAHERTNWLLAPPIDLLTLTSSTRAHQIENACTRARQFLPILTQTDLFELQRLVLTLSQALAGILIAHGPNATSALPISSTAPSALISIREEPRNPTENPSTSASAAAAKSATVLGSGSSALSSSLPNPTEISSEFLASAAANSNLAVSALVAAGLPARPPHSSGEANSASSIAGTFITTAYASADPIIGSAHGDMPLLSEMFPMLKAPFAKFGAENGVVLDNPSLYASLSSHRMALPSETSNTVDVKILYPPYQPCDSTTSYLTRAHPRLVRNAMTHAFIEHPWLKGSCSLTTPRNEIAAVIHEGRSKLNASGIPVQEQWSLIPSLLTTARRSNGASLNIPSSEVEILPCNGYDGFATIAALVDVVSKSWLCNSRVLDRLVQPGEQKQSSDSPQDFTETLNLSRASSTDTVPNKPGQIEAIVALRRVRQPTPHLAWRVASVLTSCRPTGSNFETNRTILAQKLRMALEPVISENKPTDPEVVPGGVSLAWLGLGVGDSLYSDEPLLAGGVYDGDSDDWDTSVQSDESLGASTSEFPHDERQATVVDPVSLFKSKLIHETLLYGAHLNNIAESRANNDLQEGFEVVPKLNTTEQFAWAGRAMCSILSLPRVPAHHILRASLGCDLPNQRVLARGPSRASQGALTQRDRIFAELSRTVRVLGSQQEPIPTQTSTDLSPRNESESEPSGTGLTWGLINIFNDYKSHLLSALLASEVIPPALRKDDPLSHILKHLSKDASSKDVSLLVESGDSLKSQVGPNGNMNVFSQLSFATNSLSFGLAALTLYRKRLATLAARAISAGVMHLIDLAYLPTISPLGALVDSSIIRCPLVPSPAPVLVRDQVLGEPTRASGLKSPSLVPRNQGEPTTTNASRSVSLGSPSLSSETDPTPENEQEAKPDSEQSEKLSTPLPLTQDHRQQQRYQMQLRISLMQHTAWLHALRQTLDQYSSIPLPGTYELIPLGETAFVRHVPSTGSLGNFHTQQLALARRLAADYSRYARAVSTVLDPLLHLVASPLPQAFQHVLHEPRKLVISLSSGRALSPSGKSSERQQLVVPIKLPSASVTRWTEAWVPSATVVCLLASITSSFRAGVFSTNEWTSKVLGALNSSAFFSQSSTSLRAWIQVVWRCLFGGSISCPNSSYISPPAGHISNIINASNYPSIKDFSSEGGSSRSGIESGISPPSEAVDRNTFLSMFNVFSTGAPEPSMGSEHGKKDSPAEIVPTAIGALTLTILTRNREKQASASQSSARGDLTSRMIMATLRVLPSHINYIHCETRRRNNVLSLIQKTLPTGGWKLFSSSHARTSEYLERARALRRLAFAIFSSEVDAFAGQCAELVSAFTDALRMALHVHPMAFMIHANAIIGLRCLLLRISSRQLYHVWTALFAECDMVLRVLASAMVSAEAQGIGSSLTAGISRNSLHALPPSVARDIVTPSGEVDLSSPLLLRHPGFLSLVLECCKALDLCLVLTPDMFFTHSWQFCASQSLTLSADIISNEGTHSSEMSAMSEGSMGPRIKQSTTHFHPSLECLHVFDLLARVTSQHLRPELITGAHLLDHPPQAAPGQRLNALSRPLIQLQRLGQVEELTFFFHEIRVVLAASGPHGVNSRYMRRNRQMPTPSPASITVASHNSQPFRSRVKLADAAGYCSNVASGLSLVAAFPSAYSHQLFSYLSDTHPELTRLLVIKPNTRILLDAPRPSPLALEGMHKSGCSLSPLVLEEKSAKASLATLLEYLQTTRTGSGRSSRYRDGTEDAVVPLTEASNLVHSVDLPYVNLLLLLDFVEQLDLSES